MSDFATLLTGKQVKLVHEASLEVLENVGVLVRLEAARRCFSQHGCKVDSETQIVTFPRQVIESFRMAAPAEFTFYGRDPVYDRCIPRDSPLIVTGSSAPNIIDPVTGQERRATSADIACIAHLINNLPGYDVFSISTLAEDAPAGYFTLSRLYPALKHCLKPVRTTTTDVADAGKVLRLCYLIAGGEAQFRDHPFVTFHYCPVVSPLTMDLSSTELLMYMVEQQFPVYGSVVPNAGLTSPMTLAGTLVQCNAEFLASTALVQMVHAGTPVIYSTLPTVADLRSGAYASGGIECGMLHMACAQMAHFYNVPSGGYIGLTNAKINDAQSGYESGLSTMAGMLAGADMLNMGGLLDALKTFDFAKAVIDDEIGLMLKRVKRGFDFSQAELGLDVIKEIGPGGTFMLHQHTLEYMRSTALIPKIAERDARQVWQTKGSQDAHQRAMQRVRSILKQANLPPLPLDVEKRIHTEFPGLVVGNLELPTGW